MGVIKRAQPDRGKEKKSDKGKEKKSGSKKARIVKGKGSSSRQNEESDWHGKKHLSEVPFDLQAGLYKEKIDSNKDPDCYERLIPREYEAYGVFEPFRRCGWLAALQPIQNFLFQGDDETSKKKRGVVHRGAVVEWISTLKKVDGDKPPLTMTLTGSVSGKVVTLSMDSFRKVAGNIDYWDTEPEQRYTYPTVFELFEKGKGSTDWYDMVKFLFKIPQKDTLASYKLKRVDLIPLARVVSRIMMYNILPRKSDSASMRYYEIPLLYALLTGSPTYSLRSIMMMYLWETREQKDGACIPYIRFLSAFLQDAGAIPGNKKGRCEVITSLKYPANGLYMYNRGQTFFMKDLPKDLSYCYAKRDSSGAGASSSGDAEESTEMDMDQNVVQEMQPQQHHNQARGQSRYEHDQRDQVLAQLAEIRDGQKAQLYMQEYYQNEAFHYFEKVKHYHNQMPRKTHGMDSSQLEEIPTYPTFPHAQFWRPSPVTEEQDQDARGADLFRVAPLARSMYDSIFGPRPPHEQ